MKHRKGDESNGKYYSLFIRTGRGYNRIGTYQCISQLRITSYNVCYTKLLRPLALFPELVVRIMKFLPFYYVTYLPSMLLTGYNQSEALYGVGIILIWAIAMQGIIKLTWKQYIRKYDGVGI